jgi:hypothetical protein
MPKKAALETVMLVPVRGPRACIADVVREGNATGEFHVGDADVAARRLLTMIDGLGAQMVVRAVDPAELKHIARSYVVSELHLDVSG